MTIEQEALAAVSSGSDAIPQGGRHSGIPNVIRGLGVLERTLTESANSLDSIGDKLQEIHPAGHSETHVNVGSVLRSQKKFIQAQTAYVHTSDISSFAGAQIDFARALSIMLVSLDPGTAANLQEGYIGQLTEALEKQGIL